MPGEDLVDTVLRGTRSFTKTEDLLLDAIQDLVKDEIKSYIRKKLDSNPKLKEEFRQAVEELMEAKLREGYALLKIGKASAKLGLDLVPPHLRGELAKEFAAIFEKELAGIIEKVG